MKSAPRSRNENPRAGSQIWLISSTTTARANPAGARIRDQLPTVILAAWLASVSKNDMKPIKRKWPSLSPQGTLAKAANSQPASSAVRQDENRHQGEIIGNGQPPQHENDLVKNDNLGKALRCGKRWLCVQALIANRGFDRSEMTKAPPVFESVEFPPGKAAPSSVLC